jgi:hypothetical protein
VFFSSSFAFWEKNRRKNRKRKVMSPAAAQQQQQATGTNAKQKKELVDLECDDEFEEFNEEGARRSFLGIVLKYKMREKREIRFFFSLFSFSLARDLSLSLFCTSSLARRENTKLTHFARFYDNEQQSGREKTRRRKTWRSGRTIGTTRKRTISRRI